MIIIISISIIGIRGYGRVGVRVFRIYAFAPPPAPPPSMGRRLAPFEASFDDAVNKRKCCVGQLSFIDEHKNAALASLIRKVIRPTPTFLPSLYR